MGTGCPVDTSFSPGFAFTPPLLPATSSQICIRFCNQGPREYSGGSLNAVDDGLCTAANAVSLTTWQHINIILLSVPRDASARRRTVEMGACERPAFTPVTPQVSTPPRPLVLKLIPNTESSFIFSVLVISSRHRLHIAAGHRAGTVLEQDCAEAMALDESFLAA